MIYEGKFSLGWIRFGSASLMRLDIAFDAILIGLQFERSRSDSSSFGIKVIIPLRCEMDSSPSSCAFLKLAVKKIRYKFNGKSVFPWCFI